MFDNKMKNIALFVFHVFVFNYLNWKDIRQKLNKTNV